jgi:hypothetical protein
LFYNVRLQLPFETPFRSAEEFFNLTLQDDIDYGDDIDIEIVSDEAIKFFDEHGITVTGCEFFDFPPNFVQQIHIDGPVQCQRIKFNWAYGGDHTFNFYTVNDNWNNRNDVSSSGENKHEHISLCFDTDEVTLVNSNSIYLPSLTNVGQPHNIINGPERLRLFNITGRLKNKPYNPDIGSINMYEALEILNEYVL